MYILEIYIISVLSKYGLESGQILSDNLILSVTDLCKILVFGYFDFLTSRDHILLPKINLFP